jgi:hypothetical protein
VLDNHLAREVVPREGVQDHLSEAGNALHHQREPFRLVLHVLDIIYMSGNQGYTIEGTSEQFQGKSPAAFRRGVSTKGLATSAGRQAR